MAPAAWERLTELVVGLVETNLVEMTFSEGRLPDSRLVDVMVALVEQVGSREFTAPAQVMSDGTLRYLAIVVSLLSLRSDQPVGALPVRRTLVVEEIENGLFPNQGARVLDLLRSEAMDQDVRLVATTHSPALLDALRPKDHSGVTICDRTKDGWSRLRPLVSHPNYVELAGGGAVGRAVTKGLLENEPHREERRSLSELTRRLTLAERADAVGPGSRRHPLHFDPAVPLNSPAASRRSGADQAAAGGEVAVRLAA